MKLACLFVLCTMAGQSAAMAQSGSWASLFKISPMRHLGLESSAELHPRAANNKFMGSATKDSQPADLNSDLSVKVRSAKEAISELKMLANMPNSSVNASQDVQNHTSVTAPQVKPMSQTAKTPKRKAERSFEGNLIHSLKFMGEHGDEAVECVTKCRYGEIRHEWRECLDRCVENGLMRSTLISMLPEEKHAAHADHVEMPDVLQKRAQRKIERSTEL